MLTAALVPRVTLPKHIVGFKLTLVIRFVWSDTPHTYRTTASH